MSDNRIFAALVVIGILSVSALISQCSYNAAECRKEAIKSGMDPEKITAACRQ